MVYNQKCIGTVCYVNDKRGYTSPAARLVYPLLRGPPPARMLPTFWGVRSHPSATIHSNSERLYVKGQR